MAKSSTSTRHFLVLIVGVCILFAGVAGWFVVHDTDYHYRLDDTSDEYPRYAGELGYYDSLPPAQQALVDRAIAGEGLTIESEAETPPGIVLKDDTYYIFDREATFDWTNPPTAGTTLLGLFGFGMMAWAMRRDVQARA